VPAGFERYFEVIVDRGLAGDDQIEAAAADLVWKSSDRFRARRIDTRNRWMACARVGVTCHGHTCHGDNNSVIAFVISHNLHQAARDRKPEGAACRTTGNLPPNMRPCSSEHSAVTLERAAEMLNVSKMTAKRGRKTVQHGAPELAEPTGSRRYQSCHRGDRRTSARRSMPPSPGISGTWRQGQAAEGYAEDAA
jgi:hypothetical protein